MTKYFSGPVPDLPKLRYNKLIICFGKTEQLVDFLHGLCNDPWPQQSCSFCLKQDKIYSKVWPMWPMNNPNTFHTVMDGQVCIIRSSLLISVRRKVSSFLFSEQNLFLWYKSSDNISLLSYRLFLRNFVWFHNINMKLVTMCLISKRV